MLKSFFFAGLSVAVLASAGCAQNANANPSDGQADLEGGFSGAHEVSLVAGGPVDAFEVFEECAGTISDAPNYTVTYTGNDLRIGVRSEQDTTLVVQAPNGEWLCNDDFDGYNPFLYEGYGAGEYKVWVGTYEEDSDYRATLYFTESPSPLTE